MSPARRTPRQVLFSLSASLAVVVFSHCQGEELTVDSVIDAMIDARHAVRTAEYDAQVHSLSVSKDGKEIHVSTSIQCIFDQPNQRMLFNHSGDVYASLGDSAEFTSGSVMPGQEGRLLPFVAGYVRNDEYKADWWGIGDRKTPEHATSSISLFEPSAPPSMQHTTPLCVASLGVAMGREIRRGDSIRSILDDCQKWASVSFVGRDSSGRIELTFENSSLRRRFWINPARGFSCEEMRFTELDEKGNAKSDSGAQAIAEWQMVGDVWVPVMATTSDAFGDGRGRDIKCSVTWASVNNEIDEGRFTYKSIRGVWDGIEIVERRDGQMVQIGVVGGGFRTAESPDIGRGEKLSSRVYWLLGVNGVVLVALLACALRWRRHREGR